jgi:hypothetical protein
VQLGETRESRPILERLLRCDVTSAHEAISDILWEATSDAEAVAQLTTLAQQNVTAWEEHTQGIMGDDRADDEIATG